MRAQGGGGGFVIVARSGSRREGGRHRESGWRGIAPGFSRWANRVREPGEPSVIGVMHTAVLVSRKSYGYGRTYQYSCRYRWYF